MKFCHYITDTNPSNPKLGAELFALKCILLLILYFDLLIFYTSTLKDLNSSSTTEFFTEAQTQL